LVFITQSYVIRCLSAVELWYRVYTI